MVGDALHRQQAPRRLDGLAHRLERLAAVDADLRRERLPPGAEPEHDAARRQVVERRERRREQADVARPGVDDARADPDPLRHRGVGGHRHGRLAHEPALRLPDGLEAALPRRAARSACRRGSGACPAGRARRGPSGSPPSGSNACAGISSRRCQSRCCLPVPPPAASSSWSRRLEPPVARRPTRRRPSRRAPSARRDRRSSARRGSASSSGAGGA